MPYLKLNTNITLDQDQREPLMRRLSSLLAKETGKPERYVMVELVDGGNIMFAASDAPLAYLECKSIGLSASQAKALSAAISELLDSDLSLSADRVYIEFSHCPAEFWGWNGSTFG